MVGESVTLMKGAALPSRVDFFTAFGDSFFLSLGFLGARVFFFGEFSWCSCEGFESKLSVELLVVTGSLVDSIDKAYFPNTYRRTVLSFFVQNEMKGNIQ
jgi:hypothetical protein